MKVIPGANLIHPDELFTKTFQIAISDASKAVAKSKKVDNSAALHEQLKGVLNGKQLGSSIVCLTAILSELMFNNQDALKSSKFVQKAQELLEREGKDTSNLN